MKIIRNPQLMHFEMHQMKRKSKKIGFVPTMGALHAGHLSLIHKAAEENDCVAVSIFVNPSQFGPKEDFAAYPRPYQKDCALLKKEKVDYLFYPSVRQMYPRGYSSIVEVKDARLTDILCGKFRPGHFRGVTTVVAKLFQIVTPDRVYFGQKDYQQAMVLKKMTHDLNFSIQFILCPTLREKSGLAMSSRNQYLTLAEKEKAVCLSQQLFWVRDRLKDGVTHIRSLEKTARKALSKAGFKVDYFEIREAETLRSLAKPGRKMVALTACRLGKTRLIDNVIIKIR